MATSNYPRIVEADDNSAPTSLVTKIMHSLRNLIRDDGLRIGDVLPSEAAIGERFGASRAVVREALRSMSALGLIDIGNGRRPRVAQVDPEVLALVIDHAVQTDQVSVQQILDVRRTIEMRTVGLAALRRTEREGDEIRAFATAMRTDFTRSDIVMEHDIAFHDAIARASRNPMFALMVRSFHVLTRQTWPIGWRARGDDEERYASVACHEAIALAIAEGDRQSAEAGMAVHFDSTVRLLLASGVN